MISDTALPQNEIYIYIPFCRMIDIEDVDWPDEDWEEIFDGMERQGEDQILDQSEENAEI